jgi:DNA-binding CsgD family transcriptional regulator/predicted ATPase
LYPSPTGLIGRQEERGEIERRLEAGATRRAGLALEGAPGIGKTTLLRDAVAIARRRGFQALASWPAEPDASLAFSGLGDLFDGLPGGLVEGLPDPQRRALGAALFVADASQAPADPQALPRAVLSVLRSLSARQPLLLAVDDEQWLDRPSARALAFALCRLREEPVCVLIARRPQSDGALWPELARGFGDGGLEALTLGPLDMSAIHRLLSDELGRPLSRPMLRRIYRAAGGNPLYALAIARELEARGSDASGEGELPLPPTLADAVVRRLERLEPRAASPLLVAATMSAATIATIQAVLPAFTLSDLASAENAGIIEVVGNRVRFTHPLLASAHYQRATPIQRREVHRMVAEVVDGEVERAVHLARGAEAPDRELAVAIEQAAGTAARRGAPETAAELLEHAGRLTPVANTDARDARTVAAAEQHHAAGDIERARALLEGLLEQLPPGALRARALLQLARTRMDDFDASAALLREALTHGHEHARVSARAQLLLSELAGNGGDSGTAMEHARAAVVLAERAEDPDLLAQALAAQGVMAFFNGDGVQREVMERALALQEHADATSSYYVPSSALGNQLLWSDELAAARPLLERSLRRAADRGEELDRGGLVFHLAHLEWEAGNVESAEQYTREQASLWRQFADAQYESYALWLAAYVAARQGRLTEARGHADDAIAVAGRIGDQFIVCFSGLILAATELWTGQPQAAHERVPAIRDALVGNGHGFVGQLTIPSWSCDVEALIALDRRDEAAAVLDDLGERASKAANPNAIAIAQRCRGLLLAADGGTSAAIEAMNDALAAHERRPVPLEIGRTLLERGSLERRAKRKSAAKRSLDAAVTALEPLDATLLLDRARDELGRIGLRRAAAGDGLTPAQTRVAALVAEGLSNREIAETLYMSLRTVETHLTKAYRHHGVRSRAQLAAKLSASAAAPPEPPVTTSSHQPI